MPPSFITVVMEAVRSSETSVYSNETTGRCIPKGLNHQLLFIICDKYLQRSLMPLIVCANNSRGSNVFELWM
jgi:hypothetical protein